TQIGRGKREPHLPRQKARASFAASRTKRPPHLVSRGHRARCALSFWKSVAWVIDHFHVAIMSSGRGSLRSGIGRAEGLIGLEHRPEDDQQLPGQRNNCQLASPLAAATDL